MSPEVPPLVFTRSTYATLRLGVDRRPSRLSTYVAGGYVFRASRRPPPFIGEPDRLPGERWVAEVSCDDFASHRPSATLREAADFLRLVHQRLRQEEAR